MCHDWLLVVFVVVVVVVVVTVGDAHQVINSPKTLGFSFFCGAIILSPWHVVHLASKKGRYAVRYTFPSGAGSMFWAFRSNNRQRSL